MLLSGQRKEEKPENRSLNTPSAFQLTRLLPSARSVSLIFLYIHDLSVWLFNVGHRVVVLLLNQCN